MAKVLTEEGWKEERVDSGDNAGVIVSSSVNKSIPIDIQRTRLPIYKYKDEILYLLEKYQTLVIQGETGCGKSTQLPQYLADAGWTKHPDGHTLMIGVTQPRRVAATTLAKRVAEERRVRLGDDVGFSIRFDDCSSPGKTQIKFVTEGVLIKEMMSDPLLTSYSVIMIDEAHERTLNTDMLLGLLKKIIRKRTDLKLIISSATLEAESIREFFEKNPTSDHGKDTATILCIEGRTFPVEIFYLEEAVADYVKASIDTVIKIHENEPRGDILVFLTGQEEVDEVVSTLKDYSRGLRESTSSSQDRMKMYVLPMYSALPASEQFKVFETFPKSVRKVVVATNVAEASITINGIVYVVDCGYVKIRVFNHRTCTDALIVVPTSKASAQQRAGRAGRLKAGKVYRLYLEEEYEKFEDFTRPEIQRTSLASPILQLKALGVNNFLKFELPAEPPESNVVAALELLYALDALDDKGKLTDPLGLQMAEFPVHPQFAKMLLCSGQFECSDEILTIAAMLQVENIFVQPGGGQRARDARKAKYELSVEEGDLITYLNVYNLFIKAGKVRSWADRHYLNYKALLRAVEVRQRLERLLKRFKIPIITANGDLDAIRKCVVKGFFANAAYLHHSGVYKTVRGDHDLHIHPSSVLYTRPRPPPWVLFVEVLHTTKEYMRDAIVIDPKWLYELAPHFYEYGTDREIAEQKYLRSKDSR